MKLKHIAEFEKKRLEKENQFIKKQLSRLPDGEIHFHKNGKRFRWRHFTEDISSASSRRIYKNLCKTDDKAIQLARELSLKHFLQNQLANNNQRIRALSEFEQNYPDPPAVSLRENGMCEDYHAFLESCFAHKRSQLKQWMNEPYEKSTNHPENLIFEANNGILMRSKSEVLIANMLLERGIPFRYEQALHCGSAVYYPDFTILNPADMTTLIIWEHFGGMDSELYLFKNMGKFEAYCREGFYYGKNLIVTFESKAAPLTEETVALRIDEMFGDMMMLL